MYRLRSPPLCLPSFLNIPESVVTGIGNLIRVEVRERIVSHGSGLRIIICRVGVKVPQVLGSILSNTEITYGGLHLSTTHTTLTCNTPLEVLLVPVLT